MTDQLVPYILPVMGLILLVLLWRDTVKSNREYRRKMEEIDREHTSRMCSLMAEGARYRMRMRALRKRLEAEE